MFRECYRILVADDDDNDRLLIVQAFVEAVGQRGVVHAVSDGEEAIQYLRGEGVFEDRNQYPFPSLILLDLKMPRVDGLGVLQFLAHNPAWSVVPRVVFSSSVDEDDVKKAYLVGATAYHQKPVSAPELRTMAAMIVQYWICCEVPPVDQNGRLVVTDSTGRIGERIPDPGGGERMERLE